MEKVADKKKKGFRLSNFKTDKSKEEEGVWVPYENGFEILIARMGNRRFKEFMMKKGKKHMRQLERGTIDLDTADELMREAILETILLDWRNLLDDNDQQIPYSKEEARKALAIDDFYKEIFELAQQRELYAIEDEKAAQGN